MTQLKISVLVENRASQTFLGEHGLSFVIRSDNKTVLFDTGKGEILEHNIKVMNLNPEKIDALVLSHGHYDHTGGLEHLAKCLNTEIQVYAHPAALEPKFSKSSTVFKYIGISKNNRNYLQKLDTNLIFTEKPTKITENISCTGEIPRTNSIENRSTKFYLDKTTSNPDIMRDDQALYINTEKGVVVLLGCCHAGFANTIDYIAKLAKTETIYAVIGGTHLRNANFAQLDFTASVLKKYQVQLFAPCHCSGGLSSAYLYAKNPNIFRECHTGTSFIF